MGRLVVALCGLAMFTSLAGGTPVAGQEQRVTAAEAWVKLPAAGETQAMAFASFENSTMYDVYLTSATADVAGKVELRDARRSGDLASKPIDFINVPAHESVSLDPKQVHMLLLDLKRPLSEGDRVTLKVTTDGGVSLEIPAVVKKQ